MRKGIHYGWIILAITFITLLLVQGIRLSFGAFIEPWEESFQSSRTQITLVSLISYLVFAVLQPFIGRLIDKIGMKKIVIISVLTVGAALLFTTFASKPWHLIILYGIVASIGFGGTSNVIGTLVVAKWFTKKKGLAMGIMSAGTATGQFSVVPFSIFLIEAYSWETAILILGLTVLFLLLPLLLFLFRPTPEEMGQQPYGGYDKKPERIVLAGNSEIKRKTFLFTRPFLFLFFSFFICGVTTSGLIDTHLVPFAQYCGFSAAFAGTAVSVLALFNFTGTIASGYLSDKWDSRYILGFLYGARALTIVILLVIVNETSIFGYFITESHLLIIFSISFGVVDFATVAPTMKLASEYAEKGVIGLMIGLLFFGHQVGAALGSFLPGVFFDLYGGYDITFILSIILCVIASVMCFMLPKFNQSE